jgi:endoribonuclease Dicer
VFRVLDGKTTEPSGSVVKNHEITPVDIAIPSVHQTTIDPSTQVVLALATRSSEAVISDLKSSQGAPKPPSSTTYGLTVKQGQKWLKDLAEGKIEQISDEGEDFESESDKNVFPATTSRKISERKRVRNAVYQSHFRNTFLKPQPKEIAVVSSADVESQSTRYLVKRKEMKNIISSPREYQVELFERAKERNVIAVLDTGKTEI